MLNHHFKIILRRHAVRGCALLLLQFGCAKIDLPTVPPPPPPPEIVAAEVLLQPAAVTKARGEVFSCSLRVVKAPQLLAARFHLHFNLDLMQLQGLRLFDSSRVAFFDTTLTQRGNFASLSLLAASPKLLPNDTTLCILAFRAQQRTGRDSIYFARSSSLTSLRDTSNLAIAIDRFTATKVEITN